MYLCQKSRIGLHRTRRGTCAPNRFSLKGIFFFFSPPHLSLSFKDRLPDRHSCLNLYHCVIKVQSINLSLCLPVSVCLSVCLSVSPSVSHVSNTVFQSLTQHLTIHKFHPGLKGKGLPSDELTCGFTDSSLSSAARASRAP